MMMSTYMAPLRDMRFVMTELAGISELSALPGCEEVTPELAEAVLDEAAKLATEVLAPLNKSGDEEGARLTQDGVVAENGFAKAYRQFVAGGWSGLSGDPDFGGQGLPELLHAATVEMWNSSNMAFALCPLLTAGATEALRQHGSDELKGRYLPNLVSGKWTGTMNLTEPQAGSDLAAVRAKAVPEGDHYRISGQKIFITFGEHDMAANIVHLVLARLPDAPEGTKGISLFIVPKFLVNADGSLGERNDVHCSGIEHKLGLNGNPTCTLNYGERSGGALAYLMGEPNRGLEYMFIMMNAARFSVGVQAIGIADRAYQSALAYAKERVQSRDVAARSPQPVAIIRHPDGRRMLMSMKGQIEAIRALTYVTAAELDESHAAPGEAARRRARAFAEFMIPIVKG